MSRHIRTFFLVWIGLLSACASNPKHSAPVVNGWKQAKGKNQIYTVQRKDTLYSIAFMYDIDYQDLAKANHIRAPYALKPGQPLFIASRSVAMARSVAHRPPKKSMLKAKAPRPQIHYAPQNKGWAWPTRGRVVNAFNIRQKMKGVDIAGQKNQAVRAIGSGVVVYSGSGLRGYGRMVIVKHSSKYLSAYAYNRKLLVREGSRVKRGQMIARMGSKRAGGPAMLHFELRRDGQPINPQRYIKVRT